MAMTGAGLRDVRIGFIPLIDCAIPVAAAKLGFAERQGLRLILSREPSWAAVRDKVAFGRLDGAQMLAGMPIAATLGIGQMRVPMIAPMGLGLGGNAITVSADLHRRMVAADPAAMAGPRGLSGRALARVVDERRRQGRDPLVFAVVFPVSSHNYELRCWLASAGIDPDVDVQITVIPPPRMVESLEAGRIAGYCVGEPWNQLAVERGLGCIVATKLDIWPSSPEKVLGLRADWAEAHPDIVADLVRALVEAARWADQPENRPRLAEILAEVRYVGTDPAAIRACVLGQPRLIAGAAPEPLPDYHVFYRYAATFPWTSQAAWLIDQMRRWRQIGAPGDGQDPAGDAVDGAAVARRVFRPDLYRAAVAGMDVAVPSSDWKAEGCHADRFTVRAVGGEPIAMAPDRGLLSALPA